MTAIQGKAAHDWSMTGYIRNAWYVGAYSREVIEDKPFQRLIMNEPLAFFRTASGKAAVIHDMCPHRFAPLSAGKVRGEALECGYHGFTFDAAGACVAMPGAETIPPTVCVRAYPVVEKWGLVFVWMGDPARANEDKLPPLHYYDDPEWVGESDILHVECNYALLRDNLMDLTHAKFLHGSTLATDDVTEFPLTVETEPHVIRIKRAMVNIEKTSPFMNMHGRFEDRVTHTQNVQFTPPYTVVIDVAVFSSEESTEDKRVDFRVLNALVPETDRTTNYFWAFKRNFRRDDAELTKAGYEGNKAAFLEDKWMVERQQEMMERLGPDRSMAGPHDKGVLMVQKWVRELLEAEQKEFSQAAE